jgi:hypothetical protein
MSLLEYMA